MLTLKKDNVNDGKAADWIYLWGPAKINWEDISRHHSLPSVIWEAFVPLANTEQMHQAYMWSLSFLNRSSMHKMYERSNSEWNAQTYANHGGYCYYSQIVISLKPMHLLMVLSMQQHSGWQGSLTNKPLSYLLWNLPRFVNHRWRKPYQGIHIYCCHLFITKTFSYLHSTSDTAKPD